MTCECSPPTYMSAHTQIINKSLKWKTKLINWKLIEHKIYKLKTELPDNILSLQIATKTALSKKEGKKSGKWKW